MENISFLEALKHCATTGSYWLWLIVGIVIFVAGVISLKVSYEKEGWSSGKSGISLLLIAILLAAFAYRPSEISANTTKDQAARGVYIGY
jgi:tryptophan-rich sensory protein